VTDPHVAAPRGRPYSTEIVTDAPAFERLAPEWDELLESSDQQVFFLRWHWNWLWWQYFAPKGGELHVLCCRDGKGRQALDVLAGFGL
jgi:hypothetical protein